MDKKKYNIKCPHCKKEMYATKSIFHEMGLYDLGYARCIKCEKEMKLIYVPEEDTMRADYFENYRR